MRHVVIGNSYAALGAMEAIRAIDDHASITVISDESEPAYARPLITFWLGGSVPTERMFYRPTDFYTRQRIEPLLGVRAVKIDRGYKRVLLADGRAVPYDRLLIATGGKPFIPEIAGLSPAVKNVHTFTRWEDARALRSLCAPGKRAVVLGGGLIGLKAAEGLNDAGVATTVVHRGPRILSAALDGISGSMAQERLAANGIEVITGATVAEVTTDGSHAIAGVRLADGTRLECDMLVIAVGVRPDASLAREAGLAVECGVVTDPFMRTSDPDIHAAGDVALTENVLTGARETIAIVPVACEQGRVAGRNMAGIATRYAGALPMNSVEIYGLPIVSVGITSPVDAGWDEAIHRTPDGYRKLLFHGERLKGAILVGNVENAGVLTHIIRSARLLPEETRARLRAGDLRPLPCR